MIVPMKKISLVVLKSEQKQALSVLKQLKVLHVHHKTVNTEHLQSLQAMRTMLWQAQAFISDAAKKCKIKKNNSQCPLLSRMETIRHAENAIALQNEKNEIGEQITRLSTEIDQYRLWGHFDPRDLEHVAQAGVHLIPIECSQKTYQHLPQTVQTFFLSERKGVVRSVIVSDEPTLPVNLPSDIRPLALPSVSTKEIVEQRAHLHKKQPQIELKLANHAVYLESIQVLLKQTEKEIAFETVRAGMDEIALDTEATYADVCVLTGFAPEEKVSSIKEAGVQQGWGVLIEEPTDDDLVPTQLKHNRFVRLINPLTDFLGTIPGYHEPDISLWFLLFFGVFVALIFGDAGYGAVLAGISIFGIVQAKRKKQPVAPVFPFFFYLAVLIIVWGVIVCNWFGIPAEDMPSWVQSLSIPAFSNLTPAIVRNRNQMHLCFTLGLIQLVIGHIISIKRNIRSLKYIADIGSILMLIGMYFVVLYLIISKEDFPITNVVLALILVGFVLNFLFAHYEGDFVKGVLSSLGNIITMCLGAVNVFADIMSYIRLWAVALAGGAISVTVNTMAGSMLGGLLIFFALLLLMFGHGLNYIMNVLSVIVHGVRLNTLEFSNHVGLTWAGIKYEPFGE